MRICNRSSLVALGLVLLAARPSAEELFTRVHPAMGTDFTLYIYASDGAAADREAERVFSIVDQLESLLSNYQPQSELSRINREAANHAVTTDPETFRFLKESVAWSARSDGAFDITVGKLMKVWGFFRRTGRVPTDAALARVRAETGWKRVVLTAGTRTVRFTTQGVELDPGGIGKGFAVDAAIEAMRSDGVRAALLSAGSSTIYGLGTPPDTEGWRVRACLIHSMREAFCPRRCCAILRFRRRIVQRSTLSRAVTSTATLWIRGRCGR
jgi:FAD:protein FMN transferase